MQSSYTVAGTLMVLIAKLCNSCCFIREHGLLKLAIQADVERLFNIDRQVEYFVKKINRVTKGID